MFCSNSILKERKNFRLSSLLLTYKADKQWLTSCQVVEETGETKDDNRMKLGHWLISHMPRDIFDSEIFSRRTSYKRESGHQCQSCLKSIY